MGNSIAGRVCLQGESVQLGGSCLRGNDDIAGIAAIPNGGFRRSERGCPRKCNGTIWLHGSRAQRHRPRVRRAAQPDAGRHHAENRLGRRAENLILLQAVDGRTGQNAELEPGAEQVPERRQEITTEGGLDVLSLRDSLGKAVERLKKGGMVVSLFIDPDPAQIRASARVGADAVELHTGEYANAGGEKANEELAKLKEGVELAKELNLVVHAGHGLTYQNVRRVAAIGGG